MKWLMLAALVGCGAKWTDADADNANDARNLQLQMEVICGREDAGPTCQPAAVRAMAPVAAIPPNKARPCWRCPAP